MSLRGTQTEKNLLTAFAGESQARNRYTYFASAAGKEGFKQIEAVFIETADQEKEHAKRFFKFLEGGEAVVSASFPAGVIGDTRANLIASAEGEEHEWGSMYPGFAQTAREEGFPEIAAVFDNVSVAEKFHGERFRKLAGNIGMNLVWNRPEKVAWRCRNCGYVHVGTEAAKMCPACNHPQAYFELAATNW